MSTFTLYGKERFKALVAECRVQKGEREVKKSCRRRTGKLDPNNLKLKGLADHHLNSDVFIGNGTVNADHDAFGQGPDSETDIPFHIGMQAANTPFGRHPPDFHKRVRTAATGYRHVS